MIQTAIRLYKLGWRANDKPNELILKRSNFTDEQSIHYKSYTEIKFATKKLYKLMVNYERTSNKTSS